MNYTPSPYGTVAQDKKLYKDLAEILLDNPLYTRWGSNPFDNTIEVNFNFRTPRYYRCDNNTGYWIEYEQEDKPNTAVKGRSTLECPHIWQKYEGFTESYVYCQLCDIKERPAE